MDKQKIKDIIGNRVYVVQRDNRYMWWVNGILQRNTFGQYYVNSFSGENHFSVTFTENDLCGIDKKPANGIPVIILKE